MQMSEMIRDANLSKLHSQVPMSSKKLHEGNEYALYTVTLFGKVADNFKTSAHEKGFQIREFEYSPEAQEVRKQELEKLMQDQVTMRSSLLQWCYASYGEVRSTEYSNARSQLNAINRKQTGSLAVRDLSNLVKPEDIIMSEHLVTLLAVVPKYSQKYWLSSYETLTTYVVPMSSKKLHEDSEYALYTVTLFGKVADSFKTSAHEKGFQIREFEYSPEA